MFTIIPNTIHPDSSLHLDKIFMKKLEELDIDYLELTSSISNIELDDRIISLKDMHLSKTANNVLADSLFNYLKAKDIISF